MVVSKFILTKLIVQINGMNRSSHTILLLSTCILTLFSCQQEKEDTNKSSKTQALTISDGGIKTLALEDGVNFEGLTALKLSTIDNKEYITFYDRITHSIYLYDYQTNDLFKKISMEKDGPNAVKNANKFFIHTIDSIFVDGSMGIHLINNKGEVLTKKSKGARHKNGVVMVSPDSKSYRFNQDSYFKNGQIEMVISQIRRNSKSYEYAIYDFEKDSIIKEFVQTEEIINSFDEVLKVQEEAKKRREWNSNIFRFFNRNKNHLYSSTSISDSLYIFNKGELVKAIYAGVPTIEVANYTDYATISIAEYFEGGMSIHENPKQPAYYKQMLMSPNGRHLYRVLYHGAKPKFVDGNEKSIPNPLGATLIVINTETEELSYHELPIEEIDINHNLFVSNEGIFFRVKDQQNEDEVQFRFFKVTQ
ncbi:hypothetical protein AWW67_13780 [Roseivirga seohaensis]|uniref:Uncharacterized protein n=2 Tax=Roseivirga seohaensis TaxID=1914963 RepID=A0A150XL28_9BACT|nr:hypothetical protein AWW67_13780 [Roseivirga seohaensis]